MAKECGLQSNETNVNKLSPLTELLDKITSCVDQFIVGELKLPVLEMKVATSCPKSNCNGQLRLLSLEILQQMRKKSFTIDKKETNSLKCSKCGITCTATDRIDAALEHGFQRCFGRPRLIESEVKELIWRGLPEKPDYEDELELDRWLLNLSSIHVLVNMHDWKHRNSCFKNGRTTCRYKIPQVPVNQTSSKPLFSNNEELRAGVRSSEMSSEITQKGDILQLVIDVKKGPVFIFLTDCNEAVLSTLHCNNCVRYVQNQKVSLYYGAYASKYNTENEKALTELMRTLTIYEKRQITRRDELKKSKRSRTNARRPCCK